MTYIMSLAIVMAGDRQKKWQTFFFNGLRRERMACFGATVKGQSFVLVF